MQLTGNKIKFSEVPYNGFFADDDFELCRKHDDFNAKTQYCAPGFVVGFNPEEMVNEVTP